MNADKIKRDIETLRESIRLDWADWSKVDLSPSERKGLSQHIKWCALELNALLLAFEMADKLDARDP
ncbi:hypothetical protein [Sandarakinorhabdus oryzae]|uniref:hypothetical protein n=1 Tax=Sandarakinorhabdus oryzae TaxID=2675220 RepID=UPI0012E1B55A|nr:hypothetical protein [Sandarakinorhabdus oryzae]